MPTAPRIDPSWIALAALLAAGCTSAERIELDPPSVRFAAVGRTAKVHATPLDSRGQQVPDQICAWSSSDEKVATVTAVHNDATVTAAGPGEAHLRCKIGSALVSAQVVVRPVARVRVTPERADLVLRDDAAALRLDVVAEDTAGAAVTGQVARVSCAQEDVCRGDDRGQLWPVGAGRTTATVEVNGVTATLPVSVKDARTADGRPQPVTGNPMERYERAIREREAREAAARRSR